MPKSSGQKGKLLYILKFLEEFTDEDHSLTTANLIDKLAEKGITCDRKTIYSDIFTLTEMGYEIEQEPTRLGGGWKLLTRDFEISELKLLVDAVQSSRFVSQKKSRELIKKLEQLVSHSEAVKLNRQVYVASRVKSENESIFYIVDSIHRAIQENKQISFTYLEWNIMKELVVKGDSKRILSPWALIWKDENYYLLAYDENAESFKHFRIDKMTNMNVLEIPRVGGTLFEKVDLGSYADTTFGMMGGKEETVVLDFPEYLIGVVLDRFGKDVTIQKIQGKRFRVRVKVVVSGMFYGWLAGLGNECTIHSPVDVREKYIDWLQNCINNNKNEGV